MGLPRSSPHDNLVIELTQRCNHDCLHCYNVWKNPRPYPPGELAVSTWIPMLESVLCDTGASLVALSGGEPLLHPGVFELVDWLHDRGVDVNLITNGTLLTPETLERLAPDRIGIFEVPLLSSDRAIHDRLSGAQGAFDRVTEAIADLKLRRQRVVGVFVATRLNLPGWRETVELAVALGLDGLMFNRFNPGGRGLQHLPLLMAPPAELQAALDVAEEASDRYGISISCSIAMPPCLFDTARYRYLTFGFCAAGTERAYPTIDPAGRLRPCNHSPTILGNLAERGFAELMASAPEREFVEARPAFCAGCRVERECQGGCKAAAEACTGSPRALDPYLSAYADQVHKPR